MARQGDGDKGRCAHCALRPARARSRVVHGFLVVEPTAQLGAKELPAVAATDGDAGNAIAVEILRRGAHAAADHGAGVVTRHQGAQGGRGLGAGVGEMLWPQPQPALEQFQRMRQFFLDLRRRKRRQHRMRMRMRAERHQPRLLHLAQHVPGDGRHSGVRVAHHGIGYAVLHEAGGHEENGGQAQALEHGVDARVEVDVAVVKGEDGGRQGLGSGGA